MGFIRWIHSLTNERVVYEDQAPPDDDRVSVKDLLRFVEKQSDQNAQLIQAVLAQGASQARTMESYIELFKPKNIPSTSLEERERMKFDKIEVRESEWEGVQDLKHFNELTTLGIPPDLKD